MPTRGRIDVDLTVAVEQLGCQLEDAQPRLGDSP